MLAARGGLYEKFNPEARIIGGELANINQFPWTVSVRQYGSHRCGGSLIRVNRVLTAASCTPRNLPANFLTVRAGSTNRNTGGQLIQAADLVVHHSFVEGRFRNNIAIVFMAGSFNTALAGIALIPLHAHNAAAPTGILAQITGWGETAVDGPYSDNLRVVAVPIIAHTACVSKYSNHIFPLSADMLCAGFDHGERDFCQGDIGGPLVLNAQLIGLASFNIACGSSDYPGVYTRIASFSNWVSANV